MSITSNRIEEIDYLMSVEKSEISEKLKQQLADMVEELLSFLLKAAQSDSAWSQKLVALIILSAILLVVGTIFVKALVKFLEGLAKVLELYKNSPFSVVLGRANRKNIRRRQQFCAVLDSDLATIGKAENWNDQHFTDLEAEVETDGGYYTSALNRLRKRRSFGIRRVKSLVKAIDSTTERAILLVGEPGSGKSVALRHLAKRLAQKGQRSKNKDALIPLYINLRELERPRDSSVNADMIRNFVLDNIRRGDSDTSAFVREHWDEYKDKGIWFFLFDSFDEMPDVLHAATGSKAVNEYSQALRQFLDGMGECRGVLASREYKGPSSLPWSKFRILPLGVDRQSRLVENSFLDDGQIRRVQQHLAVGASSLGNNPLFLTLLCRHVKDGGQLPVNDNKLLASHIARLAYRDVDYISKKYGLTPEDLLVGAQRLAVLLAKNPDLSLAPRVDEIADALVQDNVWDKDEITNLVSALVDVKIGRSDVATARPGDRRYAFAHRRYQEALFVQYLVENPEYLSTVELLTNSVWREYTVTLLQTQEIHIIKPLLDSAVKLLREDADLLASENDSSELPGWQGFFSWESSSYISVLEILQEGLARRTDIIPSELSNVVKDLLSKRWNLGDSVDHYMVIKLGGLLPDTVLSDYLGTAFSSKIRKLEMIAFRQSVFLRSTSPGLGSLIRRHLAQELMAAKKMGDRLRVEALAAQLPHNIGANYVVRRCLGLRPFLVVLSVINRFLLFPVVVTSYFAKKLKFNRLAGALDEVVPVNGYRGGTEWLFSLMLPPAILFVLLILKTGQKRGEVVLSFSDILPSINPWPSVFSVGYICFFATILSIYKFRHEPGPLSPKLVISRIDLTEFGKAILVLVGTVILIACIAVIPLLIGHIAYYACRLFDPDMQVKNVYETFGLPISFVIIALGVTIAAARNFLKSRRIIKKFRRIKQSIDYDYNVFSKADSPSEAIAWLEFDKSFLTASLDLVRSALAAITRAEQLHVNGALFAALRENPTDRKIKYLRQLLGDRALAFIN